MALSDSASPVPPTAPLPGRAEAALLLAKHVRRFPAIVRWRAELQRQSLVNPCADEVRAMRLVPSPHGA